MRRSHITGPPGNGRRALLSKLPLTVLALALAALVLPSLASAAAPENLVPPKVNPSHLRQGKAAWTTWGTWTSGKPSKYQWRRCNSAGEACTDIAGATSLYYTPVAADVGHTLLTKVTVTSKEGSGEASSAPTSLVISSTSPPVWLIGGKTLAELGLKSAAIESTTGSFKVEFPTYEITISCKSSTGTGTISGTDEGELNITPQGCEYVNAPNCTVEGMPISAQVKLVLAGGKVYEKLTRESGNLMQLNLHGSWCPLFGSGTTYVNGSYAAEISSESEAVSLLSSSYLGAEEATETHLYYGSMLGYVSASSSQKLIGAYLGKEWGIW
jgi:hypothetical protein